MDSPLKVLLIEDNPDDATLLQLAISEAGLTPQFCVIDSGEALRQRLCESWDIVICDYSLPQFNANAALSLIRECGLDLPFVVVSGCIGDEAAVAIMQQGAYDCVRKDKLARLAPAIRRALDEAENRRARLLAEQELTRLAFFDELTGLSNRRHFVGRVAQLMQQPAAELGLFVVHCDRLEEICHTLGGGTCDLLLVEVARRLRLGVHEAELVGVVGYAEFALVVPAAACEGDWSRISRRINEQFATPFMVDGRELFLSPTLGISCAPRDAGEAELLLRGALVAKHSAHQRGVSEAFFHRELLQRGRQQLLVANRLRGAVARNEFEVHYQPKVGLSEQGCTEMEALVRWHDSELGPVRPDEFIPVAEQTGEIVAIGEWVLRQVCRQIAEWRRRGLGLVRVAVNVSARQLRDPGFVGVIGDALRESSLPAHALELEVTESDIMDDTEMAVAILSSIRSMGVAISVDDFGTGYSSLAYLKRLPISTLKVDRSFIQDTPHDSDSCAIVEAIIALAHGLGLKVVAEGVETQEQLEFLRHLKCEQAQGYLFSKPLPVEAVTAYLQGRLADEPVIGLAPCAVAQIP